MMLVDSKKRIWEPYRFTSKFYTKMGLSQFDFSVKFRCKSVGFLYTF